MQPDQNWRLSVSLHDGMYGRTATIDFSRRENVDMQLVQLLFKQRDTHSRALFEFTNERGELLAFRSTAYDSHTVTAIENKSH